MSKGMWLTTIGFAGLLACYLCIAWQSSVQTPDRWLLRSGITIFVLFQYARLMTMMHFDYRAKCREALTTGEGE